jgi:hypothetical protein
MDTRDFFRTLFGSCTRVHLSSVDGSRIGLADRCANAVRSFTAPLFASFDPSRNQNLRIAPPLCAVSPSRSFTNTPGDGNAARSGHHHIIRDVVVSVALLPLHPESSAAGAALRKKVELAGLALVLEEPVGFPLPEACPAAGYGFRLVVARPHFLRFLCSERASEWRRVRPTLPVGPGVGTL